MKILFSCLIICSLIGCYSESPNFELCGGGLHPYYHPQLNYQGSFFAIKNHFYKGYKEVNSENNDGIVRIRFHVNCKGQTGNFTWDTYSLDYDSIKLDDRITDQLLALTQQLDKWIPAKDEDGSALNSHKFFAFKISDGQLIDILPK